MRTHHAISDMDNRLLLHHDLLNRIQARTEFLRQVEQAPQVYASMVVEVVRRRLFSQDYMKVWVCILKCVGSVMSYVMMCVESLYGTVWY